MRKLPATFLGERLTTLSWIFILPFLIGWLGWDISHTVWTNFHEMSYLAIGALCLIAFWCLLAVVGLVAIWWLLVTLHRDRKNYPVESPTPAEG